MRLYALHKANMPSDSLVPEIFKICRYLRKAISFGNILNSIINIILNTVLVQSHDKFHILPNSVCPVPANLNNLAPFKNTKSSRNNYVRIDIIPGYSGHQKNSQIFQRLENQEITLQFSFFCNLSFSIFKLFEILTFPPTAIVLLSSKNGSTIFAKASFFMIQSESMAINKGYLLILIPAFKASALPPFFLFTRVILIPFTLPS